MSNIKKDKSARVFLALQPVEYEKFENGRKELGLKPSAYVKYLMESQTQSEPDFLKYKDLIAGISEINTSVRAIATSPEINDTDRRELYTYLDDLQKNIEKFFNRRS